MRFAFVKYQGTGNDFILMDCRNVALPNIDVEQLCHRRFGIGADGLMHLVKSDTADFKMIYYNSDGNLSSMCGNGGRCIAHFAHTLGISKNGILDFEAPDGLHHVIVDGDFVNLGMNDVVHWESRPNNTYVLNTGSPHYVIIQNKDPNDLDLISIAQNIRYNEEYKAVGINVNLVQPLSNHSLNIRTYERGVENETYSCGTGVTAAAIALQLYTGEAVPKILVKTKGGDLTVQSQRDQDRFSNIVLSGPVAKVFEGFL